MIKLYDDEVVFIKQLLVHLGAECQKLTLMSESPLVVHRKTFQLTFVNHGSGKCILGNKCYNLLNGMLILIPPNIEHSFKTQDELLLYHYHWKLDEYKDSIEDREIIEDICARW